MTKKINSAVTYRPLIKDPDMCVRGEVEKIRADYPHISKQGLEKMIFKAGIPVVKKNLKAVKM